MNLRPYHLASILTLLAGTAAAQTNLNLANEYPATSIHARVADKLAELIEEKSNGTVTVTTHHGAALGYKSADHFDAVGDGAVELASSAYSAWTGFNPAFAVSVLPFLAPTLEQTEALYKIAKPEYERVMEENNQVFLLATPWPASGLWSNDPINSPEDLKGLKIRTYDVPSTETMRAVGAYPLQISWADVSPQLSTNAIDAVLTSADAGVGAQMWDLQSDFAEINYAMPLQAVNMNRDAFEALKEDEQAAILEASAEAEAYGWSLLKTLTAENYAKMRENGMTVNEKVSPELLKSLTEAGDAYVAKWTKETGELADRMLKAYRDAIAAK